jgi:hypothetical protein
MMGKLTVLRGPSSATFMSPKGLSNFDSGLLFLTGLTQIYPGVTWSDLATGMPKPMNGWLTDLGHDVASAARSVVGVAGDAVGAVLAPVAGVVASVAGATGLTSLVGDTGNITDTLTSLLGGPSGTPDQSVLTSDQIAAINAAGASYSSTFGTMSTTDKVFLWGGGAVLALLLFKSMGKK